MQKYVTFNMVTAVSHQGFQTFEALLWLLPGGLGLGWLCQVGRLKPMGVGTEGRVSVGD